MVLAWGVSHEVMVKMSAKAAVNSRLDVKLGLEGHLPEGVLLARGLNSSKVRGRRLPFTTTWASSHSCFNEPKTGQLVFPRAASPRQGKGTAVPFMS